MYKVPRHDSETGKTGRGGIRAARFHKVPGVVRIDVQQTVIE